MFDNCIGCIFDHGLDMDDMCENCFKGGNFEPEEKEQDFAK